MMSNGEVEERTPLQCYTATDPESKEVNLLCVVCEDLISVRCVSLLSVFVLTLLYTVILR